MKTLKDLSLLSKNGWQRYVNYHEKRVQGFSSGLGALDELLEGLTGIVGIQGAPGSCKSTLALQIAAYNASKGTPVLIVDRENGDNRFRDRLLCQVNNVELAYVKSATSEELKELYIRIAKLPIYVETSPKIDYELIKNYLVQMYEVYKRPMLLVVDSLQALPKAREDERMALQAWLEQLDQLKLDFEGNLVILMTSEKSRGKYESASKEAGKGTGSIEFKCEKLLDMRGLPGSNLVAIQLVKNRDGASSTRDFYLVKCLATAELNSFVYKLQPASQADVAAFTATAERSHFSDVF